MQALPATAETVAASLSDEANTGSSIATVRLRAAVISREHRIEEMPDPCKVEAVRQAVRALAKTFGTGQGHAAPLRQGDETVIVKRARQDQTLRGLRDLAVLLVGRDLLARANELCSVTVEMLRPQPSGEMLVDVVRRKTDTEARPCILGGRSSRRCHSMARGRRHTLGLRVSGARS